MSFGKYNKKMAYMIIRKLAICFNLIFILDTKGCAYSISMHHLKCLSITLKYEIIYYIIIGWNHRSRQGEWKQLISGLNSQPPSCKKRGGENSIVKVLLLKNNVVNLRELKFSEYSWFVILTPCFIVCEKSNKSVISPNL